MKTVSLLRVPEYIKLTEEIGTWGGDISKAVLPDFFTVDYVRVYAVSELQPGRGSPSPEGR